MSIKVKVKGGRNIRAVPKEQSTTPIVAPGERKPQIVPDSVVLGIDTIGPYIQRIDAGPGIIVFPEDDVELANVVISHANTSSEVSTNNDELSFTRNVDIDQFGHITQFYNTSLSSLNFSANGTLIQANDFTIGDTSLTIGESVNSLSGLDTISVNNQASVGSINVNDLTQNRIVIVGADGELEDTSSLTFDGSTLYANSDVIITGSIDVRSQTTLSSLNVEDLTQGRVTYAGIDGELIDSANLIFDGTSLTVTNGVILDGLNVGGQTTVDSLNVEDLTPGRITYAGTDGELIDSANLIFDGTSLTVTNGVLLGGLDVSGQTTLDSLNIEDLTSGRIAYVGTDGELIDSANLTFDGTSLTATNGVLLSGLDVSGQTTVDSLNVQDLTPGRITYAGTDGELVDTANLTYDQTGLSLQNNLDVSGQSSLASVSVQDLTQGRIVYAGVNGELIDSNNLTFDGTTLTASNGVLLSGLDVAGQTTVDSLNVQDLTSGRIAYVGTDGELVDSVDLTFNGITLASRQGLFIDGIEVQGQTNLTSVNVQDLTPSRIVYAGTNGELIDSSGLTYDGVSLRASSAVFFDGLEVQGQSTFTSVNIQDLTQNRITFAGASGELVDNPNLTFDGSTFRVNTQASVSSLNVSDLTATRIVYVGTNGELVDSSGLTFDGTSLTATGGVFLDGLEVQGQSTFGSVNVEDLTSTRMVYVGTDGELVDSANITFDGTTLTSQFINVLDDLEVEGQTTLSSVNITDLNQNRIVYVGAQGELVDNNSLRFDGSTLTVDGDADITGNLTLGGNLIIGDSPVDTVNVVADFTSDLIPDDNDTYSLGTLGKNWRRVFTPEIKSDTQIVTIDVTGALNLPVGATGDRPTAATGMVRFNTSDNRFEGYDGAAWSELAGSVKDVDKDTFIRAELSAGSDNDQLDFFTGGTQRLQLDSDGSFKYGTGLNKLVIDYSTGDTVFEGTLRANNQVTTSSLNVQDLTDGRIVLAGTDGELQDNASLTFDGSTLSIDSNSTFEGTIVANNQVTAASLNVLDLVTQGIVVAGPSGELRNSANLAWDGTNLSIVGGISVDGDFSTSGGLSGDSLSVGNLVANTMIFVSETGALSSNSSVSFDGETLAVNAHTTFSGEFFLDNISENSILLAGANGEVIDSGAITFDGNTFNLDAEAVVDSLKVQDLTSDRILLAGADGNVVDNENLTFDGSLFTIDGSAEISGDLTIGGNLTLGDQTLDTINVVADFTSDLIPKDGSTYNLGESGSNWNSLYINTIDSDGDVVTFDINGAVTLPTGSTAERPTAVQGMIRYNTDDGRFEAYDGSAWTGIGGVIDTDQDTFIQAESGPGSDNDELRFFTAGEERLKVGPTGIISTDDNFVFVSNNGFYTTVGGQSATVVNGNTTISGTGSYASNFLRNTNIVGQNYVLNVGTDLTLLAGDKYSLTTSNVEITSSTIDITSEFITDLIPRDNATYDLGKGEIRDGNNDLIEVGHNWNSIYVRNIGTDSGVVKVTANGAFTVPVGTTSDRPSSLEAGMVRFNSSDGVFEGYSGAAWASLGGVKDVDQDTYIQAESSPGADNDQLEFFTAGERRFFVSETGAISTDANTNLVFALGDNSIIDVGNSIITGIDDAVNPYDAISKNYLDTQYERSFFVTKSANTYSMDLLDNDNPAKLELGDAISGNFDAANNKVTISLDPVWDSFPNTGLLEAGPEGTVPNFEFDEFGRVRSLVNVPLAVSSNAVVDFVPSIYGVIADSVRNGNTENGIRVLPDFANQKLDFYVESFDIDLEGDVTGSARVINNSNTVITTSYDYTNLDDRYLNVTGDTATGDIIAPRFRDSSNTAYYVDPSSASRLNQLVLGYGFNESSLQMSTGPTSFQYLYATSTRIGFLGTTFNFATYFDTSDNSWRVEDGSVYSRNFIDSQDETYRLNPAGPNSRFKELDLDNWLDINNNLTIYDDRIVTASGNLTLNPASGFIDANTSIITNLSDPVNSLDATNKIYVDTEITDAIDTAISNFVGGDGLTYTALTQTFDVNVDDTTIEIAADVLQVKDAGITNDKLANPAISFAAESGSTDSVELGETITFVAGEGINTAVSDNQIIIAGELANNTNIGVASFSINNFTVASGEVSVTTIDGGTF